MNKIEQKLLLWYDRNKRLLPWRDIKDPYRIWISEIMLQQTRVEAVKAYYARFLKQYPSVDVLANAEEEEVLKQWEGLGYYSRAKNMQKVAKEIVKRGGFPKTYEEWISLPGIGSYTAAAIVSNAYDVFVASVDGNVLRVMSRYLASEKDISLVSTKEFIKKEIEKFMTSRPGEINQALMELGATICLPKNPRCSICPFIGECLAFQTNKTAEYPKKEKKKQPKREEKTALFFQYQNKLWLHKREKGLLNGFYEPYIVEKWLNEIDIENTFLQQQPDSIILPLDAVNHVFTHRIWDMKGYLIILKQPFIDERGKYYSFDEINQDLPLPTAFQKFYKQICNKRTVRICSYHSFL